MFMKCIISVENKNFLLQKESASTQESENSKHSMHVKSIIICMCSGISRIRQYLRKWATWHFAWLSDWLIKWNQAIDNNSSKNDTIQLNNIINAISLKKTKIEHNRKLLW